VLYPEVPDRRAVVDAIKRRARKVHQEACRWWHVLYEAFQEDAGHAPEDLPDRLRAHGRALAEERCLGMLLGEVPQTLGCPGVGPARLRDAGLLGGFECYPAPVRQAETARRQREALEAAGERWEELRAGALAGGYAALEALRAGAHFLALLVPRGTEALVDRLEPLVEAFRASGSRAPWGRSRTRGARRGSDGAPTGGAGGVGHSGEVAGLPKPQ
jgi:hypothetical protein